MNQPNTQLARNEHAAATAIRGCRLSSRKPIASGRQARRRLGKDQRDEERVAGIETGEHQARNEGALVHVADRLAELVGHHDQHQRRRDDLRQRAGGRDDAGGHAAVVAVAQHDRQRDQAHRNHRGGDDAGGGGEQRADEHDGVGEAAADGAEQLPDGVEQILGHAGSFEHQSHEGEERDRQQRVVVHHAVDALGKRLQEVRPEFAELDADEGEDQPDRAERERRRIAQQQEHDQRREHDRRHVGDKKRCHLDSPATASAISLFSIASTRCSTSASIACTCDACGSGIRPRITAMRLISSEMPCTSSSANPMMISDLAGHCGRPPALPDCSLISTERMKNGHAGDDHDDAERHQEKHVADDVDASRAPSSAACC